MPPASPRHRRLHLTILIATAVLALNAVAVANGWSPFRVPGEAAYMDQAERDTQPQATQATSGARSGLRSGALHSSDTERS